MSKPTQPLVEVIELECAGAVELASDRDRAYFELHGDRDYYIRARIPGEYALLEGTPLVEQATHTLVIQVARGVRTRRPMSLLRRRDYPAGHIPFEHIETLVDQTGGSFEDLFPCYDDEIEE